MPKPTEKPAGLPWPLLLGLLCCATLLGMTVADADETPALPPVHLPVFTDLAAVAAQAQERRLPVLLMFSMDGCGYCRVVEEDFLKPMLRSGDYRDRVIIGMIKLDSYQSLRDFDGDEVSAADLASRYRASLTPTVVFVDPEGRELAPRVIGMTTVYFYGGDLDDGINAALQKMRGTHTAMRPSL
ncbi:MAG: thioredoxin family protein [Gammaproteobacteria bacterium]